MNEVTVSNSGTTLALS